MSKTLVPFHRYRLASDSILKIGMWLSLPKTSTNLMFFQVLTSCQNILLKQIKQKNQTPLQSLLEPWQVSICKSPTLVFLAFPLSRKARFSMLIHMVPGLKTRRLMIWWLDVLLPGWTHVYIYTHIFCIYIYTHILYNTVYIYIHIRTDSHHSHKN